MKKSFLLVAVMLMLFFASCSHYVCPTYDNNSGEQKHKGGKKGTSSLFPKNM